MAWATRFGSRFGSAASAAQPPNWWGWSTPSSLALGTSSWCPALPRGRRRYLDILISQADPLYLRGLQRYQRVVQQRNQLLRVLREGRANAEELEFWNDELAREGAAVTQRRREAMKLLSSLCAQHHRELTEEGEELRMEYRPSVDLGDSLSETESRFRQALSAFRQRELATSMTVVGPHRDDFKLLVNGMDMGTFASRGQARTLALTLRLAEVAYLAAVRGQGPIVLLDDVLSEMDAGRRRRVLEKVVQYQQVLITTTDLDLVRDFFGLEGHLFPGGRWQRVAVVRRLWQRRRVKGICSFESRDMGRWYNAKAGDLIRAV